MKPHVTIHMISSIDGKIDASRWYDKAGRCDQYVAAYDDVHELLGPASWIVGRITMQEFTSCAQFEEDDGSPIARTTHNAAPTCRQFAIVIDPSGKLTWDRSQINGDRIIEVLSDRVSDRYLRHLQSMGISYLFGGEDDIDIKQVLHELATSFGIERLLAEGGGKLNASLMAADVVDEISLLIAPVTDPSAASPVTFAGQILAAPHPLLLSDVRKRDNGIVWLRYKVCT